MRINGTETLLWLLLNNNDSLHSDYKEYFDRPIFYDVSGFRNTVKPKPMMIYEKKDGSPMTSRIVVDKRRIKAIEKRVMQERSKSNKSK